MKIMRSCTKYASISVTFLHIRPGSACIAAFAFRSSQEVHPSWAKLAAAADAPQTQSLTCFRRSHAPTFTAAKCATYPSQITKAKLKPEAVAKV